jgi:hypothetical protein
MQIKLFEIRDAHTFIPAVAVQCSTLAGSVTPEERYLLRRSGYGEDNCVLLTRLAGGKSEYDPYSWGDRTMNAAHLHIERNWNRLASGDVVDVEFSLGETKEPKLSERLSSPL